MSFNDYDDLIEVLVNAVNVKNLSKNSTQILEFIATYEQDEEGVVKKLYDMQKDNPRELNKMIEQAKSIVREERNKKK